MLSPIIRGQRKLGYNWNNLFLDHVAAVNYSMPMCPEIFHCDFLVPSHPVNELSRRGHEKLIAVLVLVSAGGGWISCPIGGVEND